MMGTWALVRPEHDPLGMPLQRQLEHVHTVQIVKSSSLIRVSMESLKLSMGWMPCALRILSFQLFQSSFYRFLKALMHNKRRTIPPIICP